MSTHRAAAVVVGAGPAGSATALRLARAGHDVLLLERSRFDGRRLGESLAPSVQPLLRELGAWEEFLALGPVPSWGTCSVWGSAVPQRHSHLSSAYGCGWHVDRRAVDALLADQARAAGARVVTGSTLERLRHTGKYWQARLSTGEEVESAVLVDATGRGASLARRLGARKHTFDRLVAVWAPIAEEAGDQHLLVETAAQGWWYSSPLPDGGGIVMLLTDADLCRDQGLAEPGRWLDALRETEHTRQRLGGTRGGAQIPAAPRVRSAASSRLVRTDDLPWLAVGDAALAVDPISGSGVVRGLRTAAAAAAALEDWLGGDPSSLSAYDHDRDEECTAYLLERAAYYGAETRWAGAFWGRRRAVAEALRHQQGNLVGA